MTAAMLLLLAAIGLAAADSHYFSESGRANLDPEEMIVEQLLKRSVSGVLPPQQTEESSSEVEVAVPSRQRRGQDEYETFLAPAEHQSNARRSVQEAEVLVKRTAEKNPFQKTGHGWGFESADLFGTMLAATTVVCSAVAVFGIVGAGAFWFKTRKQRAAASEASYPQYGGTGPAIKKKSPTAAGDASLAFSAHLHHFNQTKQKILSQGAEPTEPAGNDSESEAEGDEGDFSVYECPGLAPTGDIEVANPLFENAAAPAPAKNDAPREGD